MVKVFKPVPRGTKRSRDELVHVMDSWYKQENDMLSKQHWENKRTITALKNTLRRVNREVFIQTRNAQLIQGAYARVAAEQLETREQLQACRNLINEVFERYPAVRSEYFRDLTTEEELWGSDTESEDLMG